MRKKIDKYIAAIGIIIFMVLIALGYLVGVAGFVNDSIIFIVLILFFYFTFNKWNLSSSVFVFLILSLVPHCLGIYGFYFESPIFIQWDHLTHFMPIMAFSMLIFRFLRPYMDDEFFSFRTIFVLMIVISAAAGIGTYIEHAEFFGFLANGFGDGAFAFGAGDALPGQIVTSVEEIDAFGGGWFNTMLDLIWNNLGAAAGVIIMSIFEFILKKIPYTIVSKR